MAYSSKVVNDSSSKRHLGPLHNLKVTTSVSALKPSFAQLGLESELGVRTREQRKSMNFRKSSPPDFFDRVVRDSVIGETVIVDPAKAVGGGSDERGRKDHVSIELEL